MWLGDKVTVPWLLSFAVSIYVIQYLILAPYSQFINGTGKLYVTLCVISVGTIGFIVLAIILGKTSLGVAGVVFASCIIKSASLFLEPYQTRLILSNKTYGIFGK
jgi:O-antigen/teichoic acid export membrane protein